MRHGGERDPVRDAQPGGHVSEAGVHGVRPDVQPPGHNTVGQSLGHQQTGLLIAVQKRCSARPGWPYAYLSVDIPIQRSDFLPERWKILQGGLSHGGEIVSEYSNAWIDMRHDNARYSADPGVGWPDCVRSRGLGARLGGHLGDRVSGTTSGYRVRRQARCVTVRGRTPYPCTPVSRLPGSGEL